MNKIYSLWFHKVNISEQDKIKMYDMMGDFKSIYEATDKTYKHFGLTQKQIDRLIVSKKEIDRIKYCLEGLYKQNTKLVDLSDSNYPYYLRQISDAPIALFVRGDLKYLNQPTIAVVGSRKCSEYGFECARKLAKDLAKRGIGIVSGMALGIDEAAHKGALETGHTVAVLGTGIDVCYPSQNYNIYTSIQDKGCVVSEYFPGTPGLPYQFPKRNRIISGMSLGVVVVEAALRSGSLITANLALEHNREVFAVPGNITSQLSGGTNSLIKSGAKLVQEAQDVLDEMACYRLDFSEENEQLQLKEYDMLLAKDEIIVYDCLSWQPISVDKIVKELSWQVSVVNTLLIKLQIKGLVQRLPGNRYMRIN